MEITKTVSTVKQSICGSEIMSRISIFQSGLEAIAKDLERATKIEQINNMESRLNTVIGNIIGLESLIKNEENLTDQQKDQFYDRTNELIVFARKLLQ